MKAVRYAVVGLGNISQSALLPGFKNARNSKLTALVSGEEEKRRKLANYYGIEHTYSYEQYEDCLNSGEVDAVYIGLPNHLHSEYTIRAAVAGIHVLCEKPMAVDEAECERMIVACERSSVKLMIAYRLHFEQANLDALRIALSGRLGDLRIFTGAFCQQVADENVRVEETEEQGGGSLYDMGVYCINAARSLFQDEPVEVSAIAASQKDGRFDKNTEMTSAILRFPDERLAVLTKQQFRSGRIFGVFFARDEGWIRLSPAYDFKKPLRSQVSIDDEEPKTKQYRQTDQFGAELVYFSNCILKNKNPEPSGEEGLADVRVIRAILESAKTKERIQLPSFHKGQRVTPDQEIKKAAVKAPSPVDAPAPTR